MSKVKKILAVVISMAMMLSMSLTAFAATPAATDKATIKITGITGTPTVTLYQVASAKYGTGDKEFIEYQWASGVSITAEGAKADEINTTAQELVSNIITPISTVADTEVGATYEKEVAAGAYIAVITGASDGSVYNPIFLTATYNGEGNLIGGEISSTSNYLYGTNAVAKKSNPSIDKTVAGTKADGDKNTASVGDVLTYTITPTMPSYPANATNKTFFVSDTMSAGLTFDYTSLAITVNGATITANAAGEFIYNEKVVAKAASTSNGFNLAFDYSTLVSDAATGAVYTPTVTYNAVVNENAIVGGAGNLNDAKLYYANNPNSGQSHNDPSTTPQTGSDITVTGDQETVYTYQLALRKVDASSDATPLSGAVFGIYANEACTTLVDMVTTNDSGYAVSSKVAAGTYYVKEIAAPEGYTLNTTVYSIDASWTTATTTVTGAVTNRTYTTEAAEGSVQVGWLKNNVFYAMNTYADAAAAQAEGAAAAYLATTNTTKTSATTITGNTEGAGTALLATAIPNTKLSALPSTGGIGTTIFTIGGCLIMIAAAGLFFYSRKKNSKTQK